AASYALRLCSGTFWASARQRSAARCTAAASVPPPQPATMAAVRRHVATRTSIRTLVITLSSMRSESGHQRGVAVAVSRVAECVSRREELSVRASLARLRARGRAGLSRNAARRRDAEPDGEPVEHGARLRGLVVDADPDGIGLLEGQEVASRSGAVVAMDPVGPAWRTVGARCQAAPDAVDQPRTTRPVDAGEAEHDRRNPAGEHEALALQHAPAGEA